MSWSRWENVVKERGQREPIRVCMCVCMHVHVCARVRVCLPVCLLSPTLWHVGYLTWKQTSVCVWEK